MSTHLLIIEDEDQIRHNLVELLTLSGYEVASASSGLSGLALASQRPPDLILCDIMMPQMDGYQVLEAIRRNPGLAHLPFVFLTAKSDMVDLRRGMSLGADDYLTKPFMIKDLLAAVESRLKRYLLTPTPRPPMGYLSTIQGHDEKGTMILLTAECLYFYVVNRQCFVQHPLGTFQINRSLDTLTAELDPTQFFRANRQVLLHRQTVRKYTYWDKGKYCLYLDLVGQSQQATLTRARFGQFKHWLAGSYP
ncbi:response regulator [Spirosoma radiotolerans]|uniref:Response regulator receiver protein n=1 Tax=Spirosoma radiotolerans TaxID=1379870 RepID=A0A0E3ZZH9_9BACT|nr:response regulator [Spirosoma radiotolerans]AKD58225.1 response regulator receiver protein [Spirosoma radiotolerans]